MSKIKLTGSNSGYVEIDSAADAGNLTLQLPTSGTRLLSDAGNVFSGITTTGELDVNGKIDVSTDIVLGRNLKVTGITTLSNDVILKGGSYDVLWDSSDNALEFGTNAKATFGGAMQLYHDGNNSLIQDSGTGHVQIRSGTFTVGNAGLTKTSAIFNSGSGQQLNFNNNQKFITTNTGVVVTGICTATSFSGDGSALTGISSPTANRNFIINGAMGIWQRGTSFNSQGNGQNDYTTDRFAIGHNNSHMAAVTQQDGTGAHAKFQYCARVQRDSGNSQTDQIRFHTALETKDVKLLRGEVLTLSYYARKGANFSPSGSKLTQVIIYTGTNIDGDPNAFSGGHWTNATAVLDIYQPNTPTLTTSWQRFSHTTSAVSNSANSMIIEFRITPTGTAGANDYYEITGVQLEIGSSMTAFEHRKYSDELARCQRYFYRVSTTASGTGQYKHIGTMQYYGSRYPYGKILDLPVPMRTIPTGSHTGTIRTWTAGGSTNGSVTTINYDRNDNKFLGSNGSTTDTGNGGSGDATPITLWPSSSMSADAEL